MQSLFQPLWLEPNSNHKGRIHRIPCSESIIIVATSNLKYLAFIFTACSALVDLLGLEIQCIFFQWILKRERERRPWIMFTNWWGYFIPLRFPRLLSACHVQRIFLRSETNPFQELPYNVFSDIIRCVLTALQGDMCFLSLITSLVIALPLTIRSDHRDLVTLGSVQTSFRDA